MGIAIAGFEGLVEIYHSSTTLVLRGTRVADGQRVVLKTAGDRRPSRARIAGLVRERRLLSLAQGDGVVPLLDVMDLEGTPVLVLEDFGGTALDPVPSDLTLAERVRLAVDIARALEAVHRRGVIHKDLNPANLVWNRATSTLKLVDFGVATDLKRQDPARELGTLLEGTIRYLAPEQTGRMSCGIDRRSDLYALGATLYALFAGAPPFEGDDPLEVVYAHIARVPEALHARDPRVPAVVSALVGRLLEKAPERRYQTASGVLADLEGCARALETDGEIAAFALGAKDHREAIEVPQRLYGRTADVSALLDAFVRAAEGGRELVLVTGSPGTGKTSLVRKVYSPIAQGHGDFLEGKFDQFRLGVPYAPLGHAFGRFLRRVLSLDEATVGLWREKIARAVGRNGAVLVEILPELEALLGPLEPAQPLGAAEAENRFHLVFRALVEAIASRDHPVALFLDDLQWADVPTLRLLERIVTNADSRYLLVVGAYRSSEVDAGHPLHIAVENVRRAGVSPTVIALGALTVPQVEGLLRDTFAQDGSDIAELGALCVAKTGGNPFFLRRFVEAFGERGVASWDPTTRRWVWSVERIAALEHTENVVNFLLDRLAGLARATQLDLQHAACIGDAFDLRLLAEATGRTPAQLQADLRPAVDAELVAPLGQGWILDAGDEPGAVPDEAYAYRFVHDRIRQAAYRSMDDRDARAAHHRLGRLLAERHRAHDDGHWLFEVVNHLNKASALGLSPDEGRSLARNNLEAGRRAMRAAAFGPAAEYLEAGIAALPGEAWEHDYELALGLHADAAECAYVNARFDLLADRVGAVKEHARTQLDRIKALEIEMEARMARDDLQGAVQVALVALDQLGFALPQRPTEAEVGAAVERALEVLSAVPVDAIAAIADADDPVVAAAQRILLRASSPAYYAVPPLLPIIACTLVVTSVQRGLTTATPFAFAVYGIVLHSLGRLQDAHAYGVLAQRLVDRWPDRRFEARTRLVVNNHLCTWVAPLDSRLDALREAYRIGRDTGDFEYAAICGQCYATNAFSAGRELGALLDEAELYSGFMRNYGQSSILRLHLPLVQLARAMAGRLEDPSRLDGPEFDEAEARAFALASGSLSLVFVTLSDVLIARYHFGSAQEAWEVAEAARPYEPGAAATYHLSNFHTYAPLAAARRLDTAEPNAREGLLARIDDSLARLRVWAEAGPVNHRHRLLLVLAERARVTGETDAAAGLYLQAIEAARATRYVNDEALICEQAGRFCLSRGGVYTTIGRAFLEDAAFAYQRWGATKKVERLREEFPRLFGAHPGRRAEGFGATPSVGSGLDIDGAAVVRAARTISAEIELDKLLTTLFRTVVAAGGAQKALLLLERGGRWELAVEGTASAEPALVRAAVEALDPARYPLTVLRYALRTGESVVIDDAAEHGSLLDGDPYAAAHGVRSVLCVPVRHRGALTALLYLEHTRAPGVFTRERGELMGLLMSQAVVSLDNAQLFEAQVRLTRAQSRFVPHQFLESLERHDIAEAALGDAVAKTMTVFFSDLRSFTTMAESADARAIIRLLNDYFAAMEPCIVEAGGFIDSFNGDEIMALFDVAPERAVRAGVAMQAALERFNAASGRSLRMGIGINTGPVVLGIVGGRDRIKCGVVGDAVNVASRIEGLTKRYGGPLLIGEATRDALPDAAFSLRPVDRVAVKGRQQAQTLFEVLDAAPPDERARKEATREALRQATGLYYARAFAQAAEGFAQCLAVAPDDRVPALFLDRCRQFEVAPPPADWEGVDRLA